MAFSHNAGLRRSRRQEEEVKLQDLVQIVTNDFKTELRDENHWLLFAPFPVYARQIRVRYPKFISSLNLAFLLRFDAYN